MTDHETVPMTWLVLQEYGPSLVEYYDAIAPALAVVWYAVMAYALVSATWLLYVAIMHLRVVRDREGLTTPQKVMGYPLLILGLICDVLLNWLVVTVLLLSPPMEFLTTTRFRKYRNDTTWRGRQVRWWCRHFLEPFDAGHCG